MLANDPKIREKVMGVWEISTQPLTFTLSKGQMLIRDSRFSTKKPPLLDLPITIFLAFEPIEIVEQIDKKITRTHCGKNSKGLKRTHFHHKTKEVRMEDILKTAMANVAALADADKVNLKGKATLW